MITVANGEYTITTNNQKKLKVNFKMKKYFSETRRTSKRVVYLRACSLKRKEIILI